MRLAWLCFLFLFLNADVQKAQIVQTYIYQIQKGDFKQELKNGEVQLIVRSKSLLEFMTSNHPKDKIEKQVVRFNDGYVEFKSSDQAIHTYTNATNNKLHFNLSYMIYELEYIGPSTYRIKNALKPIPNPTQCDILIQKTLTSRVDAKKDFVINLDSQHYFSKVLLTNQILRCVKN